MAHESTVRMSRLWLCTGTCWRQDCISDRTVRRDSHGMELDWKTLFRFLDKVEHMGKESAEECGRQQPVAAEEEGSRRLQPQALDEFMGQRQFEEDLWRSVAAAKRRGEALGHMMLCGPEGCGKGRLARAIASELGVEMVVEAGEAIERREDLATIITNLGQRGILFIDDIHRLCDDVGEGLCAAMEDCQLDMAIDYGIAPRTVYLQLPRITVIGATEQPEEVSPTLLQRFQHLCDFEACDDWDVLHAVKRRATALGVEVDDDALYEIARRAAREAERLLGWARDYARHLGDGVITHEVARQTLATLDADIAGHQPEASAPKSVRLPTRLFPLTWWEFEDYVARLFDALGYQNVRVTPRVADGGKDVVMEWADPLGGHRMLYVECKHWKLRTVGPKEVKALHSAVLANPKVDEGVLVTTGSFTDGAVAYAERVGVIQLVDRWKLEELIAKAGRMGRPGMWRSGWRGIGGQDVKESVDNTGRPRTGSSDGLWVYGCLRAPAPDRELPNSDHRSSSTR